MRVWTIALLVVVVALAVAQNVPRRCKIRVDGDRTQEHRGRSLDRQQGRGRKPYKKPIDPCRELPRLGDSRKPKPTKPNRTKEPLQECELTNSSVWTNASVCTGKLRCCPGLKNSSLSFCQSLRGINKSCDPMGEKGCGCKAGLVCQNITDLTETGTRKHNGEETEDTDDVNGHSEVTDHVDQDHTTSKSRLKIRKPVKGLKKLKVKSKLHKSAKLKGLCDEEATGSLQNQ